MSDLVGVAACFKQLATHSWGAGGELLLYVEVAAADQQEGAVSKTEAPLFPVRLPVSNRAKEVIPTTRKIRRIYSMTPVPDDLAHLV